MTDYTNIDFAQLFTAYDEETIVKAIVGEISGNGHQTFIFGIPAYLPSSQENSDEKVETGQEIDVCIIKIMPETNNVIVSARVAREKKASLDSKKLEVGSIVTAKIKSLTSYGAFASIGNIDGLIHVSELSYNSINDPSEIVSVGQEIPVKILSISEENEKGRRRVKLSYKQALPDPWDSLSVKVGDVVSCVVSKVMSYGLFVTFDGMNALVHQTELSWNGYLPDPKSVAKVGDSLKVKILTINRDNKKIAASVREVEGDPWQTLDIERGDVLEAIVTKKNNSGFFLKVSTGIEGLLPNSELAYNTLERKALKNSLSVSDSVRVVLLEIDKEKRRLIFSMKHLNKESL